MKIRFANLIKGLRQLGDDVMVVTPCINPPKTFHGAKVPPCLTHMSHIMPDHKSRAHALVSLSSCVHNSIMPSI